MKKRILIAGGVQYVREYTQNGAYFISKEFYLNKIYSNYDVDNLSKKNLTVKNAYLLISNFIKYYKYDSVLISLGEGDSKNDTPLKDFKNQLVLIIELLLSNNITPVLQCHSEKNDINGYQRIVKELRQEYGLYSYLESPNLNKKQLTN